jgi:acid phosphatase (class A)
MTALAIAAAAPKPTTAPAPAAPQAPTAPIVVPRDENGVPVAPAGLLDEVTQAMPGLPTGIDDQVSAEAKGLHLPSPPKAGGLVEKGELKAMHVLQDHRTPERDAWAREMASGGSMKVWWKQSGQFRKDTGFLRGWTGTAVAAGAMGAGLVASELEKHHFDRERPYDVDPTIVPVVPKPHDSSYPSGHSTVSFAAARVFGKLDPDHAKGYYEVATKVAASRVYGGVHFPSDVVAGAALGTVVGEGALRLVPWLHPASHADAAAAAALDPAAAAAAVADDAAPAAKPATA